MRLPSWSRVLAGLFLVVLVGFLALQLTAWRRLRVMRTVVSHLASQVDSLRAGFANAEPHVVSPLLLDYQLEVPGRGEVFPAMTTNGVPEYWPMAILRVTNAAERPVMQIVSAEIPGWSRRREETVIVGAHEERQIQLEPELLPRAYSNEEIHNATLEVRARSLDGHIMYSQIRPVLVHPGSDIYWGRKFANAQVAARWVTPHDPAVMELVSAARQFIDEGRLSGYTATSGRPLDVERNVRAQCLAIFQAMQKSGISYVNGLFVMGDYFGEAQRVRLPEETLHLKSANCMDITVAFASAIENLDMEPLLVILPGHAVAGVRLTPNSSDILYVDLTVLPAGSFLSAIRSAQQVMRATPREKTLVVDVAAARMLGMYPLSSGEEPGGTVSSFSSAPAAAGK